MDISSLKEAAASADALYLWMALVSELLLISSFMLGAWLLLGSRPRTTAKKIEVSLLFLSAISGGVSYLAQTHSAALRAQIESRLEKQIEADSEIRKAFGYKE